MPFYCAAPLSTFDAAVATGAEIPIEERAPEEVTEVAGVRVAPAGVTARNPAFDVTPHHLVTGIVTDAGLLTPPFAQSLRGALDGDAAQACR